jgi:hypothetical protein
VGVTLGGSNVTGPGTGYTQRYNSGGDILEDQLVTLTGNYSATASQSPSAAYIIQMIAVKVPTGLVFGPQNDGTTSAAMTGTATNSGNTTITLNTPYFSFGGVNPGDFGIGSGSSPCANAGTINAAASCPFYVTFTPTAPGLRTATLSINGTASGSISLSGTGVATSQAATPAFTLPSPGTFSTAQTPTITSATGGSTIIYTTNNTTPTANSSCVATNGTAIANGSTVSVSTGTTTIQAIACLSGDTNSAVASGAYTISPSALAAPTLSPPSASFVGSQAVNINCPTGATCCVTVDGTTPSTNHAGACVNGANTSQVTLSTTSMVEAIATESGFTDSGIVSGSYTAQQTAGVPIFANVGGTPNTSIIVSLTSPTAGATIYYTTDGSTPSPSHGTPIANGATITLTATTVINAIATASGFTNSAVGQGIVVLNTPATGGGQLPTIVIFYF